MRPRLASSRVRFRLWPEIYCIRDRDREHLSGGGGHCFGRQMVGIIILAGDEFARIMNGQEEAPCQSRGASSISIHNSSGGRPKSAKIYIFRNPFLPSGAVGTCGAARKPQRC